MPSIQWIQSIIMQNQDKSFVKRMLRPNEYPVFDLGDGRVATHMMADAEYDGRYFSYPTILYDGKRLRRMSSNDAFAAAMRSGNVIEFDTPEEAAYFSRNYKRAVRLR